MSTRMASKRFSSEKSSVLTKEALADLNLHEFDILPNWEPTAGKIYTKVRAISARINQNFDGWPSEELKKSYRTFLGKPVFVNHVNDDPRKARGVVVAARFVENGDDKFIEVIQEVDADKFPKLAHELISGGLDSVSMGAEARICKCSYCGNEASDMLSMCSHVLSKKGQVLGRVNDDGTQEDVLIYEECRDISFFELSYVFDPADETAVVSNVLTANRKRGYGETSLPPQVDTLRDEEEDLAGYFIDPPREFQEPDLDEDYPVVEEGQPFGHRRDEEQREDFNMSRVSRNRRRQTRTRQAAPHPSGIDFDAILGEGWENEHRYPQERRRDESAWDSRFITDPISEDSSLEVGVGAEGEYYGPHGNARFWGDDAGYFWESEDGRSGESPSLQQVHFDVEDAHNHYSSINRSKGNRMSRRNRRARRRYAEEFGRNDQGEQEEVFISQTPPAEPVETGDGAADAPNNTKSDRVKTDQNRSNHTNLEARRRRARRRPRKTADSHELYKDFLEYAQGQGMDLDRMQELYDRNYETDGMDDEAEYAVHEFEEMMYDFLGVNSVDEDDRLYTLLEAPGSYEINHPYNFRGASRKRRARRRRANGVARAYDWDGNEVDVANTWQTAEELARAGYDVEAIGDDTEFGVSREEVQRGVDNIRREIENYDYFEDSYGGGKSYDHPAPRRRSSRRRPSLRARRRMAEQSDDFNLNSRADIARDVEDEEVFISETGPQTQPKDASRKRRRRQALRRRHANPTRTVTDDIAEIMGISVPFKDGWEVINNPNMPTPTLYKEISDFDGVSVRPSDDGSFSWSVTRGFKNDGSGVASSAEEAMAMAEQAYAQRTSSRKRRSNRRRVALLPEDFGIDGDSAMSYDEEAGMFVDVQPGDNGHEWYLYWDSGSDYTNVTQNLAESGTAGSLEEAIEQAAHEVSQYSPDDNPFRQSARMRRAKMSKNLKRRRRMADTNLDLAAPDGRVNVEAPVKDTTDEEAQASQFDKKDFGNNAGDHLADPDLSTDQNWAPGEGQKTSARASEIEGMRLAEAMVEAGLEAQEDRWKLAEAYTKLPANIVRDRIALLARTASAKSAVRDDKSQRPVKSAQKAPGLGQRPTLQKSANKSDDYTLYL